MRINLRTISQLRENAFCRPKFNRMLLSNYVVSRYESYMASGQYISLPMESHNNNHMGCKKCRWCDKWWALFFLQKKKWNLGHQLFLNVVILRKNSQWQWVVMKIYDSCCHWVERNCGPYTFCTILIAVKLALLCTVKKQPRPQISISLLTQ